MFKIVISDPDTGKAYQLELKENKETLIGKKIGETFRGEILGLSGYELMITGGTDKDGFPMRKDVHLQGRKRVLLSSPPGFNPVDHGQRRRKTVHGNTISDRILQINTKVVKKGPKTLEEILNPEAKSEDGDKKG